MESEGRLLQTQGSAETPEKNPSLNKTKTFPPVDLVDFFKT